MRLSWHSLIWPALVGALVPAAWPAAGGAAGSSGCGTLAVAGRWAMDEPAGAGTMVDAVGGHHGKVLHARTGLTVPAHPGFEPFYRFGRGAEFPKGSMVSVADAGALDPGACDFAVEVWVNWDAVQPMSHTTYNVVQKGRSNAPANWKLEVDGRKRRFGQAICTFDGANDGRGPVRVRSSVRVANDGRWTALRCERRGDDFIVEVNATPPVKATVPGVGPIENSSDLTVGSKRLNDADTFPGEIDNLVYWSGR